MSLGSILVRLTMNTADFDTDSRRAARIAETRAKQIDAAFRRAGAAIGAYLGAAIIGLSVAVKKSIDHMDEMSKAAQRVGLSTEEFSRLAYAAELSDVQIAALTSTLGKLTKAQAAALDVASQQAKVFEALGISVKDAEGNLRSSSDVLLEFADRFAELDGSPEAMAAGFAIFGRSFQDIVPLIKDGSGAISELMQEADELGRTVSTAGGLMAEEFNDNLTRMKALLEGASMEIAQGMLPQLVAMTDEMVAAGKATSDYEAFGRGLATVLGHLTTALGWVADAARTAGAVMASSIEQASIMLDIGKQIASLGFADGTIAGAYDRITSNRSNLFDSLGGIWSAVPVAPPTTGSFSRTETRTSGTSNAALRNVLGGSGSAAGRKPGLSDEQKAAQELQEDYSRLLAQMQERVALFGQTSEVSQLAYELEHGSLAALTEAQKQQLMALAETMDAQEIHRQKAEDDKALMKEEAQRRGEVTASLREEALLLGMTADEQEIYNRLKWAGVDAESEFGQQIIATTKALQDQRQVAQGLDVVRGAFSDFLFDAASGAKSLKDAFKDMVNSILDGITQMVSKMITEQLFGGFGSSGTGSSGGFLSSFFNMLFGGGGGSSSAGGGFLSGLFGGFGGGMAAGGPVNPSQFYMVGEQGPEMFIPNTAGRILTAEETKSVGRSRALHQTVNFMLQGDMTRNTQAQTAQRVGLATQREISRTV